MGVLQFLAYGIPNQSNTHPSLIEVPYSQIGEGRDVQLCLGCEYFLGWEGVPSKRKL